MSEKDTEATTTETNQEKQSNVAELTVQDLQGLKAIVDVASQRGAFKPNEMVSIGQIYNKLESFLQAIAEQQEVKE